MVVLRKFGFSKNWIDLIWNLISNIWYSVIINGSRRGVFTSNQGLKQGDPLSPSLFILGEEVLSKMLNQLRHMDHFISFSMSNKGLFISHLAYADVIVIFTRNSNSLKLIMKCLDKYESISSQLVNKDKSFFLTSLKTGAHRVNRIIDISHFKNKNFPFNYLRCPIYIGRKRTEYFDSMLAKIVRRLNGWQSKLMSSGGKLILIKHVLQSLPTYTLTALKPPKGILDLMGKYFARFFWESSGDKQKYHWSSWKNL